MSTPARKIVIGARPGVKGDNGNAAYMARRRAEKAERQLMFLLLLKWRRGFSPADAPPHINEWTRGPVLWYNGPRIDR